MARLHLDSKLERVVGDKTAQQFEKAFGIVTVGDLLHHYPRRYSHRGELTALTGLPIGEHVTVVAEVLDVRERRMQARRGNILEARITDGEGTLSLTWFNQAWRAKELTPGKRGVFAGKVGTYQRQLQLTHPDYELFADQNDAPGGQALTEAVAKAWAEEPVPIYPATAQLPTWTVQRSVDLVLDALGSVEDPIPADVLCQAGSTSSPLMSLSQAFEAVHRPKVDADWQAARESLKFREAFELQLALLRRKLSSATEPTTPRPKHEDGLTAELDASLPFQLTTDQRNAGQTITDELASSSPMHRLLQGEVGSGKTLVALRAMLQVADSGGQSALLAPTEVLASQHFRSITQLLGPELSARVAPVLLTGQLRVAEKKRALLSITSGAAQIVVGTHALMSETTHFYDLGLVVVDEQHRFGVEQRDALRKKSQTPPHVLVMTATPIPRTVALTAFGDLEVSTIREIPPGRPGIVTHTVPVLEHPSWQDRAWSRAAEEVAEGRQVYVVCPAISVSEREASVDDDEEEITDSAETQQRQLANVLDTVAELRAHPMLGQTVIEPLTGAMDSEDKDRVMTAFAAGKIDVLVATTVIEVGVNVPNASLMIVRDAERFGMSQLHQLRGRVGRGEHPGLCLLLTHAEPGSLARERVEAVAATIDGFELAETDLDLRREGNILGSEQSGGRSALRLLRVARDRELIERTRVLAESFLDRDPQLRSAPALIEQLRRNEANLQLANLAKS